MAVEFRVLTADGGLCRLDQHLLGQRHQLLVVGVGLIELEHRELGIVLRRHALVPEVARELVDPLDPADDQPLQVQLGRDAQEEIHVERVVVRDERPRGGAARDRLHHRRFDFEKSARVEEAPNRRDDVRPHFEDPARIRIHDQVEIALPVADLDIGEAVPLLRQRQMTLGEKRERRGPDRQLARAGPEQVAGNAHMVAEIQQLEDPEVLFRERVLPDVNLNPLQTVRQGQEARLAEAPDRQHAACGHGLDSPGVQRLG